MTDHPIALAWADWAKMPDVWNGTVSGKDLGTEISVVLYTTDTPGAGPGLHVHAYDEIFIIREGSALFTIGDREIVATKGHVLCAPAGVWHKFHNLGPGILETMDIHQAPEIEVTWAEKKADEKDSY